MRKSEALDKILSDSEKLAVKLFVENDLQREAVKKVLLFDIYYNGILSRGDTPDPLRNLALGLVSNFGAQLTDEQLGKDLRAGWAGINTLETAFSELSKFKKEPDEKREGGPSNPAR